MKQFIGEIMDVKTIALYLGVAEVTVYRLLEKEELPAKKVGGQWRIRKEDLDQWLRERN